VDWQACFRLEEGKTYRVAYVEPMDDIVKTATFDFRGEVLEGNRAVLIITDDRLSWMTHPGAINILSIEEQTARGEIR